MIRSTTKAAVLVAALLSLLLVTYVFGGSGERRTEDLPHCTPRDTLDGIKAELFRRAAQSRGANDPQFANVARYSVLRAGSRMYRRVHEGSRRVTCTGSLVLDLPPGVAAVGGRQSLQAQVAYDIEKQSGGAPRLMRLSNVDAIALPLATVSRVANGISEPVAASPVAQGPPSTESPEVQPQSAPAAQAPEMDRRSVEPQRASRPPSQRATAVATAKPPARPKSTRPVPPKPPAATRAPVSPPRVVTTPSFPCRYARTPGEIAVCRNPGLAALDREMAAQFRRAMATARPGQRVMLQRSRLRFLRFRDSCASDACVADSYRGRMREISDIANGGW